MTRRDRRMSPALEAELVLSGLRSDPGRFVLMNDVCQEAWEDPSRRTNWIFWVIRTPDGWKWFNPQLRDFVQASSSEEAVAEGLREFRAACSEGG